MKSTLFFDMFLALEALFAGHLIRFFIRGVELSWNTKLSEQDGSGSVVFAQELVWIKSLKTANLTKNEKKNSSPK